MRAIWIPQPRSEGLQAAQDPDVRLEDLLQAIAWLRGLGVGAAA